MSEVLYFSAKFCAPCRVVSKSVEKLDVEHKEVTFTKIDIEEDPERADEFGVKSLPTLVHLVDGKEVARVTGARTKEDLAKELEL